MRRKRRKGKCIDCGAEIDDRSTRCKPCYRKNQITGNHLCPDCHDLKDSQATRCMSCATKQRVGRKFSGDARQRMSEAQQKRRDRVGRIADPDRRYYDYKIWRNDVFDRDDYTCQHCESKENLRVHHMEDYAGNPELRTELSNGITFCERCHKNFHHLLGRQSTRAQVFWFLKNVKLGKE